MLSKEVAHLYLAVKLAAYALARPVGAPLGPWSPRISKQSASYIDSDTLSL